ncbi:MAG: small ribosomal subunit Rsm22 family protein [Treponema sp.]|nr:small ribosomal subunit Rsm22 family protein [Treponema sp.]
MSEKFYSRFTEKKGSQKKEEARREKKAFLTQEQGKEGQKRRSFDYAQDDRKVRQDDKAGRQDDKRGRQENRKGRQDDKRLPEGGLFSGVLSDDAQNVLNNFDAVLQSVRPLNSKQRLQLPHNIRDLSHQLTDQRGERKMTYMNDKVLLSAYANYFVWWNLVRQTKLLKGLPSSSFPKNNSICLDLGSGPLTFVTALWIARPELRNLNLTWYCLDLSQNTLALGEEIYLSVASRLPPSDEKAAPYWKIIRVKGSLSTHIKEKADFVSSANMINELEQTGEYPPEYWAKKYFGEISSFAKKDAAYLLIEPGVPKAARMLSLFRERFIAEGFDINGPCTHCGSCAMNGFKAFTGSSGKWCNFAFSTEDAPEKLAKLSESARLPKERAVLSFLSVSKPGEKPAAGSIRIISDPMRLPERITGYYGCSSDGLVLVKTRQNLKSGDIINVKEKKGDQRDEKTGAVVVNF